ncbi:hypothetical protein SK128_001862, partial [Halocaridina rubra]
RHADREAPQPAFSVIQLLQASRRRGSAKTRPTNSLLHHLTPLQARRRGGTQPVPQTAFSVIQLLYRHADGEALQPEQPTAFSIILLLYRHADGEALQPAFSVIQLLYRHV